jgi:DNA-binding beta-propeller fold protein YncE
MRGRSSASLIVVALALVACADGATPQAGPFGVPSAAGDVLVLDAGGTLTRVDAATGSVVFGAQEAVPSADWSSLYAATSNGDRTTLETLDPATGKAVDSTVIPGDLSIWAVSDGGEQVALMEPFGDAGLAWAPPSRKTTDLVVVDARSGKSETFHLNGNYVPETFSTDDENLFMLSFNPPTNPTSYRVTALYLERGKVWDVFGPNKAPVENMTATRLQQVLSPDGEALYTLYVNQPPQYLLNNGATTAEPDEVAFVHRLNLNGFALCIELPRDFGSVPAGRAAIAVSPDGAHVYAVDALHGDVASIGIKHGRVTNTMLDLSMLDGDVTAAVVSADGGTLYVGSGSAIAAIDTTTFAIRDSWAVPFGLTDLGLSADGGRLYVSSTAGVSVLDASSGHDLGEISSGGDAIAWIGNA